MNHDPCDILAFWWNAGPANWFNGGEAFDEACRAHCLGAYGAAAAGELDGWMAAPHSALALILLLDQMPRNMFRASAQMFATDGKALALADRSLAVGHHRAYPLPGRRFFYLPFMHAEDVALQRRCEALCGAAGDQEGVKYAVLHREIIERFGRFPHRNPILGRAMRPEEQAFLDAGGFSG